MKNKSAIITLVIIGLATICLGMFAVGYNCHEQYIEPIVYRNIPYEVIKTEYVEVPVEVEVVKVETEYIEVPVNHPLVDFVSIERAEAVIQECLDNIPVRFNGDTNTPDKDFDCDEYALALIEQLNNRGYRAHLAPVYYGRIFGCTVTAGADYLHVGVWLIIDNRFYYMESSPGPGAGRGELVLINGNGFDLYVD